MTNDPFQRLAEQRIQEAIEAGAFRDLPHAGKPIELEDLTHVPDELRAGYLILKGANVLPEEMDLEQRIAGLDDLISHCSDQDELAELRKARNAAALRFSILMEKRGRSQAFSDYAAKLAQRFGE